MTTGAAGLSAGKLSEANVEDEGVLDSFIDVALVNKGLSTGEGLGDWAGAGNREGSPESMLYVFGDECIGVED